MRAILFSLIIASSLFCGEYAAVVSKELSVGVLSKTYLKEVYLKKRGFLDEQKAVPINLPSGDPIRAHFEKSVLGMEMGDINEYWIEQHYKGKKPPFVQNSQESIKAFVKNMAGAIGYMEKSQVDDGLKIVYEF